MYEDTLMGHIKCGIHLSLIHIFGIISGFVAGKLMRGGWFGLFMNLLVGMVGGVLGGWVFSLFGMAATGIMCSLVTSIVGAIFLLWIVSLLKRSDISLSLIHIFGIRRMCCMDSK